MASATRTELASLKSAFAKVPAVDLTTTDRIARECRDHLASLSPERRAELEREWNA